MTRWSPRPHRRFSSVAVVVAVMVALVPTFLATSVASASPSSGGTVTSKARPSAGDSAAGRFIAVGDSIMLGARAQLDSRLSFLQWPSILDMEVSRSTLAGAQALESHSPGPADVVVISLGANDSGNADLFRNRAREVARVASAARAVFWLTIAEVRPYYPTSNVVVREVAAEFHNMEVVDWAAVAGSDPSLTARDGLHLTPSGSAAMADEIIRTVLDELWGTPAEPEAPATTVPPVEEAAPDTTAPVASQPPDSAVTPEEVSTTTGATEHGDDSTAPEASPKPTDTASGSGLPRTIGIGGVVLVVLGAGLAIVRSRRRSAGRPE